MRHQPEREEERTLTQWNPIVIRCNILVLYAFALLPANVRALPSLLANNLAVVDSLASPIRVSSSSFIAPTCSCSVPRCRSSRRYLALL